MNVIRLRMKTAAVLVYRLEVETTGYSLSPCHEGLPCGNGLFVNVEGPWRAAAAEGVQYERRACETLHRPTL